MNKKILFYVLLSIAFVASAYIVLDYLGLNSPVILPISFVFAFISRKIISFIVYRNFKEQPQ